MMPVLPFIEDAEENIHEIVRKRQNAEENLFIRHSALL